MARIIANLLSTCVVYCCIIYVYYLQLQYSENVCGRPTHKSWFLILINI